MRFMYFTTFPSALKELICIFNTRDMCLPQAKLQL